MKKQVIINGIRHYFLGYYNDKSERLTMEHPLGFALLSPSGSAGFVKYNNGWLMFEVKDYEGRR